MITPPTTPLSTSSRTFPVEDARAFVANNSFCAAAASPQPFAATLCLKSRPPLPRLPAVDQGTALLADNNLAIPDELVHGLLHRATKGVLGGSSKAGKTWMLLDLALSVATGTPFLKWPTTQGKVLFLNLEIHRAFLRGRLQRLVESKGVTNVDNLDIWTLRGQFPDAESLLRAILQRAKETEYALIILDPIYKLMVGRAENASTGVGVLCHDVERLVVETGAAVVYAHHFSKGNQSAKKAMDRLSGSGVFARDADTIVTLTEHEEEGCFAVEMTLRNLPEQLPFVVEWDYPLMNLRNDLDAKDLKGTETQGNQDNQDFVLALLDEQPLTTTEWQKLAEDDGISRATFYRVKTRLEAAGKVIHNSLTKTWTHTDGDVSRETGETCETSETSAAPEPPPTDATATPVPNAPTPA